MFKHYLTTAFRNFRRNKIFSLINVTGLGLGMTVFLMIQLWIGYERSFDRFHENADRIYRVIVDMTSPNKPVTIWQTTPAPMGPVMEDKIPEIEKIIRLSSPMEIRLQKADERFRGSVVYADSMFFKYFNFPLKSGDPKQILEPKDGIVISRTLAKEIFGDMDPAGVTLDLKEGFSEQTRAVMITGVFADVPSNSTLQFDAVMPFNTYMKYANWNRHWGNYNNFTYAVLNPAADPQRVSDKIKDFIKDNRPDTRENYAELFMHPLNRLHLYDDFTKGRQATGLIIYVKLFEIISFFVLIIAIINFINLSTANLSGRQKEAGLKKILGAGRSMLIRQFMIESFLLNLVAVLLAWQTVYLLLPGFNSMFQKHIILPDVGNLTLTLAGILLISSLITGLYPSILISGTEPVGSMKGKSIRFGNMNLRDGLVVFQFVLSISLIISIIIVYKQVEYIRNKNLGFNRENILRFGAGDIKKHQEVFRQELKKIPGVRSVTFINQNPLYVGNSTSDPKWDNKPEDEETFFHVLTADNHFLETMDITLLEGENFMEQVNPSINHYIVNETAARVMGMEDPVGQNLTFWNDNEGKIVGLVKDFNFQPLNTEMKPLIIYHQTEGNWMAMVKVTGEDLQNTILGIGKVYNTLDPGNSFEYDFLDADFDAMYYREILMQKLTLILTLLALFISALGLFGLTLYTVQRHTKEIAIRKVNGARIGQIIVLLSRNFVKWVGIAFLIASPVAWYFMSDWLRNYAYRTTIGLWVFAVAGGLALLIALITISVQTIRAALANPVDALRNE